MRTKRAFKVKKKNIFHYFWRAFSCQKLPQTLECAYKVYVRWPIDDISDVPHFFRKKDEPLFFPTVISSGNAFSTVIVFLKKRGTSEMSSMGHRRNVIYGLPYLWDLFYEIYKWFNMKNIAKDNEVIFKVTGASQLSFTCLKLAKETTKQEVKYVQS